MMPQISHVCGPRSYWLLRYANPYAPGPKPKGSIRCKEFSINRGLHILNMQTLRPTPCMHLECGSCLQVLREARYAVIFVQGVKLTGLGSRAKFRGA